MTENEKDVAVTAFIQGYAKAEGHAQKQYTNKCYLHNLARFFDIEKATDEFKKKLEAS